MYPKLLLFTLVFRLSFISRQFCQGLSVSAHMMCTIIKPNGSLCVARNRAHITQIWTTRKLKPESIQRPQLFIRLSLIRDMLLCGGDLSRDDSDLPMLMLFLAVYVFSLKLTSEALAMTSGRDG